MTKHIINQADQSGNYQSFCGVNLGDGKEHTCYEMVKTSMDTGNCTDCILKAHEAHTSLVEANRELIKAMEKMLGPAPESVVKDFADMEMVAKILSDSISKA